MAQKPYDKLYIYEMRGEAYADRELLGAALVADWLESGYTFLFMSAPSKPLAEQFAKTIPQKDVDELATALADSCYQVKCGTFVTLTLNKQLRGCIGSLTSDEPIRTGVGRNAINAAFHDPRFKPLNAADFEKVNIEVSILSEPQRLNYRDSDDLVAKLRPGVDGIIVRKDHASATFLPQVWEQLPETHDFLSHLCAKAGLAADAWRQTQLEISTYQVQHFSEPT